MHIAVNTLFLIPGEVGGTETCVREILAVLIGQPDVTRVTLITQRENHESLAGELGDSNKVDLIKLDFSAQSRVRRMLAEQLQVPRVVRRCRADLLWSPGYTAPLGRVACPQVVTIHDMQYRRFPEDLSWTFRLASELLIPPAARRCDHVLAVSQFAKQEIVTFCGVPESKVSAVPNGCNASFGQAMQDADMRRLLAEHGLVPGEFLLCVAHTHPHKCVHLAVAGYGELQRDDLKLVLVGHPRRGEPLVEEALGNLPNPENVIRLRGLSSDCLIALYQGCAAFVLPSQYEGFGLPVLEAMAAGAPVVTTQVASIPEVGGECVVYVEGDSTSVAEGLRTVLAWSPDERKTRTAAARERAAEFTWQRAGEQHCAVFRDVVAHRE